MLTLALDDLFILCQLGNTKVAFLFLHHYKILLWILLVSDSCHLVFIQRMFTFVLMLALDSFEYLGFALGLATFEKPR